jgi:DNA-directed RNA polymerase subunit L/DNA-directed RNA polymerase alpha subunit
MATESVFQKFEIVDDKTLKFTMAPVSVTYANTLRRSIQSEVSLIGFRADMLDDGSTSDVTIMKNSTPMSNEMLADRIGLLPIVMPESSTWEKESVLFSLNVKNETDDIRIVTASDFECLERQPTSEERVRIPNTRFFYPNPVTGETCIIAVLKPMAEGQAPEEIHLEAYATLGTGREHARFNPVSQCAYSYTRDDDQDRIGELWKTWLMQQKKVDLKDLEKDDSRKDILEREFRSLEIYRCFKIDADGEPYSYDFTVETVGTMDVYRIVLNALIAIAERCDKYSALDKGDVEVDIRPADARMKGFDVWFQKEDHTLGNLLQTWLDTNKLGNGVLTFAGYKVPHPLRDEMVLRVGVEDGSEASVRLLVAEAAKACADMFREWAVEWSVGAEKGGIKTPGGDLKTVWQAHADSKSVAK